MSSTPTASAAESTCSLHDHAGYGALPLDRFVLEHWDYTRPTDQDQKQWDELARRWLSMDYTDRKPYYEAAESLQLDCASADDPRMPTQEQINRVLSPYQTVQERNASVYNADCALVRTCYSPSLSPTYDLIKETYIKVMGDDTALALIFDNEALYSDINLSNNPHTNLFLRTPELTRHDKVLEPVEYQLEEQDDETEAQAILRNALNNERLLIYVLDEEALRKNMIRLAWFSLKGECIWWNWLPVEDLRIGMA